MSKIVGKTQTICFFGKNFNIVKTLVKPFIFGFDAFLPLYDKLY